MLWALRRPLTRALDGDSAFKPRLLAGCGLLLLPVLAYLLLDQRPGQSFDNQYLNELAENGPYQFFHAFRDAELSYAQFYIQHDDAAVAAQLRRQVQQSNQTFLTPAGYDLARHVDNTDRGPERNLNVMLIVVESLSAKYLGAYGTTDADTTGLTPNLDRLAAQSLWLSNLYATGTRTVRGLESLTLSVPPTPGESIVKRPDNGGLFSLGQLFAARGYDSTFLYGGFGYFDNMNDFFGKNGFRIVDRAAMTAPEIAFANIWGVADESLYGRAMREADGDFARGQPFFQLVMTTSNHRPYSYPDGRIDIPSKTGRAGAVKYTDWAIGDLLEKARQKPWFNDTLFVIVADHCAGSDGRTALPLDRYRIPLFVYSPAHVQPQRIERLVGQIDVAPTLLGLLHWNYDSRFFGKDILRMTRRRRTGPAEQLPAPGPAGPPAAGGAVAGRQGQRAGTGRRPHGPSAGSRQPAARPGPGALPGRRAGISPAPWPVARNARQSGAPACRPPVKGARDAPCPYYPCSRQQGIPDP